MDAKEGKDLQAKDAKEKFVVYDMFNIGKYQAALKTKFLGRYFLYRVVTDTTMNDAKTECDRGGASGTVVLAESQTRGQGRKGRAWASDLKGNLYFTFFLRFSDFSVASALNFSVAIAVAKACESVGVKAGIKWPNDVLVDGKKLCGMLINTEKSLEDNNFIAHVGVGVNINEDMTKNVDPEVQKIATSVSNCLGKPIDRESFLATFFNVLELELIPLNWPQLLEVYIKYSVILNKTVTVAPKQREDLSDQYEAKAIQFSPEGYLIVQLPDGKEISLKSEEVMIRIAAAVVPSEKVDPKPSASKKKKDKPQPPSEKEES